MPVFVIASWTNKLVECSMNCVTHLTFFVNFRSVSEERRGEYPVRKDIGPDTCRKWTHYRSASRSSFCLCLRTALIYRRKLLSTPLHSPTIPFLKHIYRDLCFLFTLMEAVLLYLYKVRWILSDPVNNNFRLLQRLIQTLNISKVCVEIFEENNNFVNFTNQECLQP